MTKSLYVKAKNDEQKEALQALLNPEIDLVILSGIAGSGKTLLAVACGLQQIMETKSYNKMIFTRAPVSVGEDMGFLPGTIEEKLMPWLGALMDNIEYLKMDMKDMERYLSFTAIQHMRGRSFTNKWIIIDEVQNISKEQMKVLITRAGEGTKIVALGDYSQVDNRKLSAENNGLKYIIDKSEGYSFIKHVGLPASVRSRLCQWGSEL